MLGMFFKTLVLVMAVCGLSMCLTHWIPSLWSAGYTVPMVKIHVTWAVTALLGFAMVILAKFNYS